MSARYDTFVILAESLQWDETAIDLTPDIHAWPALGDGESTQVLGLIAGFCIAESAVSGHLGAFQAAASDDSVAACFRAQARDEHRHARFFDRVAAEVAAVPGAGLAAGQDAMLDALDRLSPGLPGVRRGVELVLRDERWHIGFGTRLVRDSGLGRDDVEALLALGQTAAGAWGELVSPGAAARAARVHRSRLRVVDMKFF